MATGESCDICNKFMERGDNKQWKNAVELEAEHRNSDRIFYFFICPECATKQEVDA